VTPVSTAVVASFAGRQPAGVIALAAPAALMVPGISYCPEEATPEMLAALEEERDRMTQRIQFLARNRDAIASYLDVARTTGLPGRGGIS